MKTENTKKEKAIFFAHYYGMQFLTSNSMGLISYETLKHWGGIWKDAYLPLTPLKNISDEDAISVAQIIFPQDENWSPRIYNDPDTGRQFIKYYDIQEDRPYSVRNLLAKTLQVSDYLRSRGYILPYKDLSIDDLLNYNWIKYI